MDNRRVAEKWAQAMKDHDLVAQAEYTHPDIVATYPQSGETIRGRDNYFAMLSNFPTSLPEANVAELHGTGESVHVSSSAPFTIPIITISGGGDTFFSWASFGYGWELTGDPQFLEKATAMSGGSDPLSGLIYRLKNGNTNLEATYQPGFRLLDDSTLKVSFAYDIDTVPTLFVADGSGVLEAGACPVGCVGVQM